MYAYVHNNPIKLVDPFGLTAEMKGEDSQVTWSNRTRDDNGVTWHYEDARYHDPYRDTGESSAPSYADVARDSYEAARNQQRAEAYGRAERNDLAKLQHEPIPFVDTSETWKTAYFVGTGLVGGAELALGMSALRGIGLYAASRGATGRVGSSFGPSSAGAAQRIIGKIVQSGGNKINKTTADSLNRATGSSLTPREWGRGLEALKKDFDLPNNHHGKITEYGHYLDEAGNPIGNILEYL